MKKIKALILAGVMVLSIAALTGCGKECSACGETSSDGQEIFGEFICQDCLDSASSMMGF